MRIRSWSISFLLACALQSHAVAQSGIGLAGSGYSNPALIRVAPAQVVTLFLTGIPPLVPVNQTGAWAADVPWPAALAGVSATVTQSGRSPEGLPILAVTQQTACSDQTNTAPACISTALTVQMPADLSVPNLLASAAAPQTTQVTITVNGASSQGFLVSPVAVDAHILRSCDSVFQSHAASCSPIVTHANGSLVSTAAPAAPGEILVGYAYGLGATSPAVPAGQTTRTPAPTTRSQFAITFEYANPLGPLPSQAQISNAALNLLFVGLVPGQVGLYQFNFIVQLPAFAPPSCPADGGPNLLVGLVPSAFASISDAVAICVDTSQNANNRATTVRR